MGKNHVDVASDLISKLKSKEFSSVKVAGPYLNFKLKTELLIENVLNEISKECEKYGQNKKGKKERIMIEFSNVNTHKEYHIGHLRNIAYGDAVVRILNKCGQNVIPVSYVNDFGIHVAKTLWAYLEFYKDTELPENKGEFLGEIYVKASNESKENKLVKGMIEAIIKKIESRDGKEYELWQKTRKWSIEQFDKIYDELGVKFEKKYYESEFIDKGKKQVDDLLKKDILVKSRGAVIADLEKYNLGVLVILRSDGTATYPVADIPLAEAKFKDYKFDKSIYIVDTAQSLYFKQLFKILELMGYTEEKVHLSYDVVKLPSGKMSSRLGNTVTYAELKQKLFDKALEETSKRHEDWDKQKQEENAWEIAKGAMKFEMIKIGSDQIITFNIDKALSFQGYTSAYLQYTIARINSIIKKSEIKINKLRRCFYRRDN